MKTCLKCKQSKPKDDFYNNTSTKDGKTTYCKDCDQEYKRNYRINHRDKVNGERRKWDRKMRASDQSYAIYRSLTSHCYRKQHKNKVCFKLVELREWLKTQKQVCHYCGHTLRGTPPRSQRFFDTLTIDRKDNNKPYTLDNIALACFRCNSVKNQWLTESQMMEIADLYFAKGSNMAAKIEEARKEGFVEGQADVGHNEAILRAVNAAAEQTKIEERKAIGKWIEEHKLGYHQEASGEIISIESIKDVNQLWQSLSSGEQPGGE